MSLGNSGNNHLIRQSLPRMRSGKGSRDFEDYEDEEADNNPRRDTAPSTNVAPAHSKDVDKNNDKASATRLKHSVMEQRRRSKINERFKILRDLIPHSDQKRDTASFLLEVIDYVRFLQGRVQTYEGSYQGWDSEPAKLIPWRNSHWRVANQPHAVNSGSGTLTGFSDKLEENTTSAGMPPSILASTQNSLAMGASRDPSSMYLVWPSDFSKLGTSTNLPASVPSDYVKTRPTQESPDPQDTQCCAPEYFGDQREDLVIEGGTINISSVYSQGLLNSLTNALQSSGLDLSQARISIQVDIGKRAYEGFLTETSTVKHHVSTHLDKALAPGLQNVGSVEE